MALIKSEIIQISSTLDYFTVTGSNRSTHSYQTIHLADRQPWVTHKWNGGCSDQEKKFTHIPRSTRPSLILPCSVYLICSVWSDWRPAQHISAQQIQHNVPTDHHQCYRIDTKQLYTLMKFSNLHKNVQACCYRPNKNTVV